MTPHADCSLGGIIAQMGPIAMGVAVALLLMSIWSVHVMIDRVVTFWRSSRQSRLALEEAYTALQESRLEEAVIAARRRPEAALGRIAGAAIASAAKDRRRGMPLDLDAAERCVEKERVQVVARLRRGLTSLATIAATAPFVGLFGTVVGIINAFTGMAEAGSGGFAAISAGIAEALFTTAFGLMVAIPAVWLYNHFNARIEQVHADIDTVKVDVVDMLLRPEPARATA